MVILSIPVVWSITDDPANFKMIILFWLIVKDWLNSVHTDKDIIDQNINWIVIGAGSRTVKRWKSVCSWI